MKRNKAKNKVALKPTQSKRIYVKQTDIPAASLDEALRVPQSIFDNFGGKAVAPLMVAKALNVDPMGSQMKLLTGAAIAYGLAEGGSQASEISVTDLSSRILRPKVEGEEISAKREAFLKPRIFREFLRQYNSHPLPRNDIAVNVLEGMGIDRSKAEDVFKRIVSSAQSVGFIETIKEKQYVSLQGVDLSKGEDSENGASPAATQDQVDFDVTTGTMDDKLSQSAAKEKPAASKINQTLTYSGANYAAAIVDDERRRRVFITHGKNKEFVESIRKLLQFGEMVPVVSVDKQTVSQPVPLKVMNDMRSCGAAIIHVNNDKPAADPQDQSPIPLNPNVLIEIGAAMALYGQRFILLVLDGIKLPSNLQGLYEVRYSGEMPDAAATIKLLEAIRDIKNHPLPNDPPASE